MIRQTAIDKAVNQLQRAYVHASPLCTFFVVCVLKNTRTLRE